MADAEEDSSLIASAAVVENVDSPVQLSPNASEKQIDVESEPKKVTTSVASPSSQPSKDKIDLLLKATGDAPIMKQKKWSVEADRKVGGIIQFIKKYLKLEPHDTLFLYVNQSFAPSPDQILRNLYECFGAEGKLVLHYCKTQAWG